MTNSREIDTDETEIFKNVDFGFRHADFEKRMFPEENRFPEEIKRPV